MGAASKPGELMTTEDFVADEIGESMEECPRGRAFFTTLALVMILDQLFFFLHDALFIENKILSLVQMTADRRRPPPPFFATAWGSMLQHFAGENQPKKDSLYCP